MMVKSSRARMAVVLFLSALVLTMTLPDAARWWFPLGSLNGALRTITNNGRSVDLPKTPYHDRIRAVVGFVAHPCDTALTAPQDCPDAVRIAVAAPQADAGSSSQRKITIETIAGEDLANRDGTYYGLIVLREIVALIFVGLGATLLLLRPGVLTWMLFLFCLRVAASAPALALQAYLPPIGADLEEAFYDVIPAVGYISALVFAARFSGPGANGWREWCVRSAPWLFVTLGALGIFSEYGRTWFGWETATKVTTVALNVCDGVICCVAVVALLPRGTNRQEGGRGQTSTAPPEWIIAAAFAIALSGFLIDDNFGSSAAYVWHSSLLMLSGVVFIAIVYSVVRYQFLDIRMYITAAVSGGILTSIAILVFDQFSRISDRVLDEKFRQHGVPAALTLIVTIGAGAALHRLFSGGEKMVESLAYHARIEARKRLRQVVLDVADATSIEALTNLLCERVVEEFGPSSAAFFQIAEGGEFRQANPTVGLDDRETTSLEPTDALVRELASDKRLDPIRLDARLGLPVRLRGHLAAFVIYGGLRHGEKWESDDTEALRQLSLAATAALYRIEADRVRSGR
jgi:hypothetical protein